MMQVILQESHNPGVLAQMKVRKLGRPVPAVDIVVFRKALGRVLAEAREGARLSQAKLAEMLDVSQPAIGKAETGKHILRTETWLKIGQVLSIPFYELFQRALEKDGQTQGDMSRRVFALDKEEEELVLLWREMETKGQEEVINWTRSCARRFRLPENVVPILPSQVKKTRTLSPRK